MLFFYQFRKVGLRSNNFLSSISSQLLFQTKNPGLKFEYTIPKNQTVTHKLVFSWKYRDWTSCSATCGIGKWYLVYWLSFFDGLLVVKYILLLLAILLYAFYLRHWLDSKAHHCARPVRVGSRGLSEFPAVRFGCDTEMHWSRRPGKIRCTQTWESQKFQLTF